MMLIRSLIFLSVQNTLLGNFVLDYDPINFKNNIENLHANFITFYTNWCSHSNEFFKTLNEIAHKFDGISPNVAFARIDCSLHFRLCQEYDITGYPTLLYFHKNSFVPVEYNKTRDFPSIASFLYKMSGANSDITNSIQNINLYLEMNELNESNIEKFISVGQHFILFYAPWCRASQRLAPVWSQLSLLHSQDKELKISKVNCAESESTCRNFDIKQYPYMVWIANGRITGACDAESLEELQDYVKRMLLTENHNAEKYMKRKKADPVLRIAEQALEPYLERDVVFINFIAPWCAHCMQQSPVWSNLAIKYENETRVLIADVDCTRSKLLCEKEKINNLPTLVLYKNQVRVKVEHGTQPFDTLVDIVEEHLNSGSQKETTEVKVINKDEL